MATARSNRSEGGGWFVTLAGLGILTVAGFGVGLLAGALWEEPGLVAHHLLGDTEEVDWASAEAPAGPAAPAAAEKTAAKPEPAPAPAAKSASRSGSDRGGAVSAAPPEGSMAVQVGAFGESRAAEELATKLRGRGFPVYVSPGTAAGEPRWRVRVGPFPTRERADSAAAKLKREHQLPTWVLDEARS